MARMGRSQYQEIAEIIAAMSFENRAIAAMHFCEELKRRHPEFKPDRFLKAVDNEYMRLSREK